MEKDVNVDLPPFKSLLVAECYIYPNKPVELSLTQTQDYFTQSGDTAILKNLFVNDADVKIIYEGKTYQMVYNPIPNLAEFKYFNYYLKDSIPYNEGEPIYLQVTDKHGRSISAETKWLSKVPVDSISYKFPGPMDTLTYLIVYFKDDPSTQDYYRFQAKRLNADTGSRINHEVLDYSTDDALFNGQEITLGTSKRFKHGDTASVTLLHIPYDYYRFMVSTQAAQSANGNPFSEPATIESNIKGGMGIFTAFPMIEGQESKTIIIK
jgi:hypothetical protein